MIADRRPIKVIRPWAGLRDHPRGLRPGWRTAAEYCDSLAGELDRGHASGFRRFVVMVPAGKPHGQDHHGLSHWHHLPHAVRSFLVEWLPGWLFDRADVVVSPYLGFHVTTGRRYHAPFSAARIPSSEEIADAVEPWLALSPQPGQVGIGLDASMRDDCRAGFLAFAEEMRARGVWTMGEAIPEGPNGPHPDALLVPCWARRALLEIRDPAHQWTWNAATTEAIVLLQRGDSGAAADYAARGYVLASAHDDLDAEVL